MADDYHFGKGGRLGAAAEDALVQSAYRHDCADADILLRGLNVADMAHAVALLEADVLPQDAAKPLFAALAATSQLPDDAITVDERLGDVYNCREAYLKGEYGDISGWLNAGRARREAVNLSFLLAMRGRMLTLSAKLGRLGRAMEHLARDHTDTLMPDFTYLHHAQPTVFGHYLMTFAFPILRDFDRLTAYYEKLNQSPAGSASVNGSGLGLDRARLSDLMGFAKPVTHTRDAMWQVDVPIEGMTALVSMMTNLSRLCEELQVWNTGEFGVLDLPDSLCRASVIMPQKKNPYPLTYIRGLTGDLLGKVASFASFGKIASGNPDSRTFIYGALPRAMDRCAEALELLAAVLEGLELNKDLLAKRANGGFLYATDLAEALMLKHALDYRTAHKIVGAYVKRRHEAGEAAGDKVADINAAFADVTGQNADIDAAWFEETTKASAIVKTRTGLGGAAPDALNAAIDEFSRGLSAAEANWAEKSKLSELTELKSIVHNLCGEVPNV